MDSQQLVAWLLIIGYFYGIIICLNPPIINYLFIFLSLVLLLSHESRKVLWRNKRGSSIVYITRKVKPTGPYHVTLIIMPIWSLDHANFNFLTNAANCHLFLLCIYVNYTSPFFFSVCRFQCSFPHQHDIIYCFHFQL